MVQEDRVVVLVDMDCFYCQVEERLNPNLTGKPIAVVQYNQWRGGGIIAVNYPARDRGVTRHMRGHEAKKKCPEINLVSVPNIRGKADLTKYREAGKRVADVLQTFTPLLERASVDEAYLDITTAVENRIDNMVSNLKPDNYTNTFVVGSSIEHFLHNIYSDVSINGKNLKLAVGAFITEQIRAAVYEKTGYRCSAGIAHNKILAKLVCGLNKPNKQTVLPEEGVFELYRKLPLTKIKSLGGKFGVMVTEKLGITTMGELSELSEAKLQKYFDEKTANWLYNIARGIDLEPVTTRLISKSIGCCKKFPGKTALKSKEQITHWLQELAEEISERLEKDSQENNRKAKQIIVSFAQQINNKDVASSRTTTLTSHEKMKIVQSAFEIIKKHCELPDGSFHVTYLGFSASNFESVKNVREITSFFKTSDNNVSKNNNSTKSITDFLKLMKKPEKEICGNSNCSTEVNIQEEIEVDTKNDDDKSDDSAYSATTEEMDQSIEGLAFYPDEFRLKSNNSVVPHYEQNSKEFINTNRSLENIPHTITSEMTEKDNSLLATEFETVDDENSIESELYIPAGIEQQPSSFFKSYFDNVKKSPVERNFDTSISLQEISENVSDGNEDDDNQDNVEPEGNKSNESIILPISTAYVSVDNDKEICSECNKSVSRSEIIFHMDYHYALKIVREESKIYKEQSHQSLKLNKAKEPVKVKSKKRKRGMETSDKKLTITEFFTNNDTSNEIVLGGLYETCAECKKQIKYEDFSSHMDYHVAKKLHLEINSIETFPMQHAKGETKSSKKDMKLNTVTTYFKPL